MLKVNTVTQLTASGYHETPPLLPPPLPPPQLTQLKRNMILCTHTRNVTGTILIALSNCQYMNVLQSLMHKKGHCDKEGLINTTFYKEKLGLESMPHTY